MTGLTL